MSARYIIAYRNLSPHCERAGCDDDAELSIVIVSEDDDGPCGAAQIFVCSDHHAEFHDLARDPECLRDFVRRVIAVQSRPPPDEMVN